MTDKLTDWRSPDGITNALSLRSEYRRGFNPAMCLRGSMI
jgi:hypothetical protein